MDLSPSRPKGTVPRERLRSLRAACPPPFQHEEHAMKSAAAVVCCLVALVTGEFALAQSPAPPITLNTLLQEMVDRDAVARWPAPAYTCKQASSYDRQRTGPGQAELVRQCRRDAIHPRREECGPRRTRDDGRRRPGRHRPVLADDPRQGGHAADISRRCGRRRRSSSPPMI